MRGVRGGTLIAILIALLLAACGRHAGGGGVLPPGSARKAQALSVGIVQSHAVSGAIGTTLSATPAAGNLLVAIAFDGVSTIGCGTGWTKIRLVSANYDDGVTCYRVVNGDTATVTPFTSGSAASVGGYVWEVSGQAASPIDAEAGSEAGPRSNTLTISPVQSGDVVLGGAAMNTNLPAVNPTGFTLDFAQSPFGTGTGFSAFFSHEPNALAGSQQVTWSFSSTTDTHPVTAMMVAIAPGTAGTPPPPTPTPSPTATPAPTPVPTPTPTGGGAGGPLSIIQSHQIVGGVSATFTSIPRSGDLLVGIGFNGKTSINCGATWTKLRSLAARYDDGIICYRVVSGDGASVTPFASSNNANVGGYVWELAGQAPSAIDASAGMEGGTHSLAVSIAPAQSGDVVLGGAAINSGLRAIDPTGFTQDFTQTPYGTTTGFSAIFSHQSNAASGSESVTWGFNSSTDTHPVTVMMVAIGPGAAGTPAPPTPTPVPTPTPTQGPSADWSTMGFDVERTGYNPNEHTIGTGSFGTLHSLWSSSPSVSGGEIGEPVYASNVSINGQNVNVLYVGSQLGLVYAFNADTGATIWSKQLDTATYSCGTFTGTFGVNGAPVLDRSRNRIYVGTGANTVHALDLATGSEAAGWPVAIGTNTGRDFIYGGLTFNASNGLLYAETSTTCDISPWYGRISAINTSNATVVNTFYPSQGQSGGGIWGFGGASIDPATNNVFVATGNTDSSTGNSQSAFYGEQIVEFSSDLSSVLAHSYATLPPGSDSDYGATPLLFQPPGCPALLAAVNKSGLFVLYNRGNINAGPVQTIQMSIATDNGDFVGVPSYSPVTNYVYVGLPATQGIYRPGAAAFSINATCTLNTTPAWSAQFGADGASLTSDDTPRSPITIANGVAYVSDYQTSTTYAFNAATGAQLWTRSLSGKGIVGPIVVNGHLYIGNMSGGPTAWTP